MSGGYYDDEETDEMLHQRLERERAAFFADLRTAVRRAADEANEEAIRQYRDALLNAEERRRLEEVRREVEAYEWQQQPKGRKGDVG